MLTVLLILAALILLGGNDLLDRIKSLRQYLPKVAVTWQHVAAAFLVLLAFASISIPKKAPAPEPTPTPSVLSLAGLFTGPTAAEDAAIVSALTGELADELEWDWGQEKPQFTTGVAVDELRRRAREFRCRGVSIGARQPDARDAIARHLDAAVGTGGGPIDDAKKAAWLKALREVSEAAADVTR